MSLLLAGIKIRPEMQRKLGYNAMLKRQMEIQRWWWCQLFGTPLHLPRRGATRGSMG